MLKDPITIPHGALTRRHTWKLSGQGSRDVEVGRHFAGTGGVVNQPSFERLARQAVVRVGRRGGGADVLGSHGVGREESVPRGGAGGRLLVACSPGSAGLGDLAGEVGGLASQNVGDVVARGSAVRRLLLLLAWTTCRRRRDVVVRMVGRAAPHIPQVGARVSRRGRVGCEVVVRPGARVVHGVRPVHARVGSRVAVLGPHSRTTGRRRVGKLHSL